MEGGRYESIDDQETIEQTNDIWHRSGNSGNYSINTHAGVAALPILMVEYTLTNNTKERIMNSKLSNKVSEMANKTIDDAIANGERFTAKMANDAIAEAIAHFCKK